MPGRSPTPTSRSTRDGPGARRRSRATSRGNRTRSGRRHGRCRLGARGTVRTTSMTRVEAGERAGSGGVSMNRPERPAVAAYGREARRRDDQRNCLQGIPARALRFEADRSHRPDVGDRPSTRRPSDQRRRSRPADGRTGPARAAELSQPAHMLGFRGPLPNKSQRYGVTFRASTTSGPLDRVTDARPRSRSTTTSLS